MNIYAMQTLLVAAQIMQNGSHIVTSLLGDKHENRKPITDGNLVERSKETVSLNTPMSS